MSIFSSGQFKKQYFDKIVIEESSGKTTFLSRVLSANELSDNSVKLEGNSISSILVELNALV